LLLLLLLLLLLPVVAQNENCVCEVGRKATLQNYIWTCSFINISE